MIHTIILGVIEFMILVVDIPQHKNIFYVGIKFFSCGMSMNSKHIFFSIILRLYCVKILLAMELNFMYTNLLANCVSKYIYYDRVNLLFYIFRKRILFKTLKTHKLIKI